MRVLVKKNKILNICIFMAVLCLLFGFCFNKEKDTYISDSYVSLSAFIMLIGTALMQNKDLKLQREELKNSRESLDKQSEELEKHSLEFAKTNQFNNEQLNMSKFFELLKMKEDLYTEVVGQGENTLNGFTDKFMNNLKSEFEKNLHRIPECSMYKEIIDNSNIAQLIEYYKVSEEDFVEDEDFTLDNKNNFDEIFKSNFEDSLKSVLSITNVPGKLLKLHTLNNLINDMYGEHVNIFNVMSNVTKNIQKAKNKALGIREETDLIDIHSKLRTEDEVLLDKIVNQSITIKDID